MTRTRKCCVPKCPGPCTIFYKFPIPGWESDTIKEWVKRIDNPRFQELNEQKIYSRFHICDLHFGEHCRVADKTRLKKGSLPTILVPGFKGDPEDVSSQIYLVTKAEDSGLPIRKPFFQSIKSKDLSEVCRICLKPTQNFVKLYAEEGEDIWKMLTQVVPHVKLGLYPNSVICSRCTDLTRASFKLWETSKSTEEKIQGVLDTEQYALRCDNNNNTDLILGEETTQEVALIDHNYSKLPKTGALEDKPVSKPKETSLYSGNSWSPGPFLCHICGLTVKYRKTFSQHVARHSPKFRPKQRTDICHVCGKGFVSLVYLKKHCERHKIVRKCEKCDIVFATFRALQIHNKNKHAEVCYLCYICGKKLAHASAFRTHLLRHTENKKFSCQICDKKFKMKVDLVRHYYKHAPTMNKCQECDKCFKYNTSLKLHVRAFHTESKTTKCDICLRTFFRKSSLMRHKIKIHGWNPHVG